MRQERTKSYSLAQNSLFNTAGMMTYYLCQWAMTMAAVRLSTEEDVGAMQLAMTVSNIFISLANYNMRTFQISDIRGEYAAGHYVAARLITCGAAMACSIVYSLLWGYSAQSLITIGLYMLYRMNESLADVLHGIDQRHERLDHVMVSGTVRGVSMLAVFTAVLWLTKSMIAAIAAIAAITLAEVVLYDLRAAARYESVRPRFEKAKLVRLLTVCLPEAVPGGAAGRGAAGLLRHHRHTADVCADAGQQPDESLPGTDRGGGGPAGPAGLYGHDREDAVDDHGTDAGLPGRGRPAGRAGHGADLRGEDPELRAADVRGGGMHGTVRGRMPRIQPAGD